MAGNTAVATTGNQKTMSLYLEQPGVKHMIDNLLKERSSQFVLALTTLANSTPQLKACDQNTLLSVALKATALNLPIDPALGLCWAVPYKTTASFQLGYKGIVNLALRSGQYKAINAMEVREGEFKGRDMFGEPMIVWADETTRETLPIAGYMAAMQLTTGYSKIVYWPMQKVKEHAMKYSQGYRYFINNGGSTSSAKSGNKESPWASDFDAMAKKTVLKNLITKWGIMSTELQQAVQYDQAVIKTDIDTGEEIVIYSDNEQEPAPILVSHEKMAYLLKTYGKDAVETSLATLGLETLESLPCDNVEEFEEICKAHKQDKQPDKKEDKKATEKAEPATDTKGKQDKSEDKKTDMGEDW